MTLLLSKVLEERVTFIKALKDESMLIAKKMELDPFLINCEAYHFILLFDLISTL